jgi:type I restriction enzyme S subunit
LEEQRAIAHVLRTVQQAKEATEQVIAAARELKASLVGVYVTPEETPRMWSTRAIEEVASRVEYGISKRGGPAGRYPILRMNSISNGRVITDDLQWVDLTDDEFRRFKLERGDVLFNRTNSIDKVGKAAYFDLDGDWVFASYLLRVAADNAVLDPRFLNYFLGAPSTQARLKGLATRAVSQANINATKLKDLTMPVPPLLEQRDIADAIQAVDAKVDAEEAGRDALATLYNSLLQDLMSARLRVADLNAEVA